MELPAASVLIVDDSPDKLVALQAVLATLPVEIVTARSGKEALRRLLERDFAVILLDVKMAGMDGFETAALIRKRARSEQTPIIFVTAFPDENHAVRGYSLRAVDYIMTPVVPDVLRTKVSVLVDLFRTTAQVRRQAESLRQRAAQLHALTTASLDINAAVSIDRMLEVVTTSAREILGAERAVALATLDAQRKHCAAIPPLRATEDESDAALSSVVVRTNRPCRTTRGELAVPLIGSDGRNMGLVLISRKPEAEFTQEEEDLLAQLAHMTSIAIENRIFSEAHEANRLKDEFLATVSHELRTPLNAMLSWAWMLRSGSVTPETTARAVEAIERNVKAQARIVDDLLDVSRIITGKLRLNSRLVDFAAVAEQAIEAVMAAADAKGIRIGRTLEVAAGLVVGDPDRLQQVVWNLLSNAIKFTPRGGRVEVELRHRGSDLELHVTDTGQGIAPAFLPYVFDRFRQADGSTTRRAGGLGLGLAIVRHLVELQGGQVDAYSAGEGRGATFVVTLPAAASTEATLAVDVADVSGADGTNRLDGLHVLVVEDEPDTRDALCLLMSQAGASVTGAGSAGEALAAFEAARPDLLLCDIGLPGEDGYALLAKLHARTENGDGPLPAIALTAYAGERERAHALASGFLNHIAKPVKPDELLRVVVNTAARAQPGRRAAAE